jgi:sugar phosphate isomerase/epimerase
LDLRARFGQKSPFSAMKALLFALSACLLGSPLLADDPTAAGSFHGVAGLQLYSLRNEFKKDGVTATLDRVKGYGFTEVETAGTYDLSAADFRKELEKRGLQPISGHFQYDALKKDLAGAIRDAKALGLKYAICPWITHEIADFTEADARRAATDFNTWGEAFRKEGISFGYHCHGYEFRPRDDGSTLFDLIVAETKPENVLFEMDVFWVTSPGVDPVKLLEKYPTRWKLMHLKDMRKGARTGVYTGHADLTDDVPLGTGQVNWPAVLSTAAKVGVQHYFIEDESPTSTAGIPKSLAYLETLKAK